MVWATLGRLMWSPVRQGENAAQTIVRVIGNLLRWVIGLPIVVGLIGWGVFSFHSWWSERPYRLTGLEGVEIGMTPTEVTLIKGAPRTSVPEQRDDGSWSQGMFFGEQLVIFSGESEDALRVYRICLTEPRYYDRVIGVAGSDTEAEVIRHLGQPDSVSINDDGLRKQSSFERYNLMIVFEKARADTICVGT